MTDVGGYQLEEPVGTGAHATVWRARQPGPVARTVALKRIEGAAGSDELERLRREAALLADLDHPHVVRVIEVLDDGDGVAIVMQHAAGGSLAGLLDERGRLEPGEVVAVAAPVAEALASAHRRGVVHGDVKPANILFTSDGEPLLGDFGVARLLGGVADGAVTGTAGYLAPELFDGAPPDARSDIYALGVVCYEALTGRVPFDGSSDDEVVETARRGDHPPLGRAAAGAPVALVQAVERAMARDPAQRTSDAAELARELRAAVAQGALALPAAGADGPAAVTGRRGTRTFGPRPPAAGGGGRGWTRGWRLAAAALLVAALAVAALGVRRLVTGDGDEERAGPCPPVGAPAPAPGATVLTGDLDGDGCPTWAIWDGSQLLALVDRDDGEARAFGLQPAGSTLLLGDWDCDGVETPALYDPATGRIYYFDRWAAAGEQLESREAVETGRVAADASVADADGDGCADVVLTAGGG